jgi:uncharacterized protein YndB with AHSA1/START domain
MASHEFDLVTNWHVKAPVAAVWALLNVPEDWPSWWRAVKRVEPIGNGDSQGIGARRRFTWRTALPYQITFDMTATRIEPLRTLEGRAEGELNGVGTWTLSEAPGGTNVRYDWKVTLEMPWQRTLAPVLRPVFTWNHNVVMGWGDQDIKKKLGIALN